MNSLSHCLAPQLALGILLLAPCVAAQQGFTVNGPFIPGKYSPLTGHERWQRWWSEDGGSPTIHVEVAVFASALQEDNDPAEWGRNTGGMARRIGSEYGSILIGNSVHEGMAAAMGSDPRYFACACKGLVRRTGHALEMTLLTYNRNGHKMLDLPALSGTYGSAMIADLWWPSNYSPLVQGVQVGGLEVGLAGAVHVLQEFSPELKRFFHVGGHTSLASAPPKP